MSNASGASLFGSAIVGVLAGAAVSSIITAFCDDETEEQQKRNGRIENVCMITGAALCVGYCVTRNNS